MAALGAARVGPARDGAALTTPEGLGAREFDRRWIVAAWSGSGGLAQQDVPRLATHLLEDLEAADSDVDAG